LGVSIAIRGSFVNGPLSIHCGPRSWKIFAAIRARIFDDLRDARGVRVDRLIDRV